MNIRLATGIHAEGVAPPPHASALEALSLRERVRSALRACSQNTPSSEGFSKVCSRALSKRSLPCRSQSTSKTIPECSLSDYRTLPNCSLGDLIAKAKLAPVFLWGSGIRVPLGNKEFSHSIFSHSSLISLIFVRV